MYEDLFAVIVNGVLYTQSVADSEDKSKRKFVDYISSKRNYSLVLWENEVKKGAEVKPITITVNN